MNFRPLPPLLLAAAIALAGCSSGDSRFSLLPQSLRKNPSVDMTAITEMTAEGRSEPAPSADRPEYFSVQSISYHDEGMAYGKSGPLPLPEVQGLLLQALAGQHLLLADAGHSGGMALVLTCGSANTIDNRTAAGFSTGSGVKAPTMSAAFPTAAAPSSDFDPGTDIPPPPPDVTGQTDYATRQNFLTRAALVGGDAFAHEVANALNQEDELVRSGSGLATTRPLDLLENKSPLFRQLVEAAKGDRYYVVVSAYAARASANGRPQLLWRSKMTASSDGVAMADSLPTLIRSAAPYLGTDMREAAIVPARPL